MTISMDKKYRTRDGREVRIYAVDGAEPNSVHGALGGEWSGQEETMKDAADKIERLLQQVEDLALVARGAAHRIEDTKKSHRFLAMIDKVVGGER